MTEQVLCVDFGSTFTKAALVDTGTGELVATATHRTTIGTDLLEALDEVRSRVGHRDVEVLACSSAGGGLRVGVVGHEELVTGEAGRRVATSSGGWVVHVASGPLADTGELLAARPDVLLLVGGTDGGNAKVLLANARTLAGARLDIPIVVAGNRDCRDEIAAMFAETDTPCVVTENVLPEIGVVRPDAARAAIREVFVRHVIGGKHLSRRDEFTRIVVGATPDLVLRGVELLAEQVAGDVAVVDVGGATTDVHSVTALDDESHDVVATLPVSRTVEGDLGLRWNAVGVVEAAVDLGVLEPSEAARLRPEAELRRDRPGLVASSPAQLAVDERLATLAIVVALRRHAGRDRVRFGADGRVVERSGKSLRKVGLLVGSGGILRHADVHTARRILTDALVDDGGGWLLPECPRIALDRSYVLAAAGLLAERAPEAARELLRIRLTDR